MDPSRPPSWSRAEVQLELQALRALFATLPPPDPVASLPLQAGLPADEVERRVVALVREDDVLQMRLAIGLRHAQLRRQPVPTAHQVGRQAHEVVDLLRIGARITRLPRVAAAFVRGEIGWQQVRLLTRVATAANEAELLERVRERRLRRLRFRRLGPWEPLG